MILIRLERAGLSDYTADELTLDDILKRTCSWIIIWRICYDEKVRIKCWDSAIGIHQNLFILFRKRNLCEPKSFSKETKDIKMKIKSLICKAQHCCCACVFYSEYRQFIYYWRRTQIKRINATWLITTAHLNADDYIALQWQQEPDTSYYYIKEDFCQCLRNNKFSILISQNDVNRASVKFRFCSTLKAHIYLGGGEIKAGLWILFYTPFKQQYNKHIKTELLLLYKRRCCNGCYMITEINCLALQHTENQLSQNYGMEILKLPKQA